MHTLRIHNNTNDIYYKIYGHIHKINYKRNDH